MQVLERSEGSLHVSGCLTHANHEMSASYLHLSMAERDLASHACYSSGGHPPTSTSNW